MAESPVLSQAQFRKRAPDRPHDPSGDPRFNKIKFSGVPGKSKTMHIARGHVPHPPSEHPHHRKAGKRSRRAR